MKKESEFDLVSALSLNIHISYTEVVLLEMMQ